jgi:hypothetical protein
MKDSDRGAPAIIVVMAASIFGLVYLAGEIEIALSAKSPILALLAGPIMFYLGYKIIKIIYLLISGEV